MRNTKYFFPKTYNYAHIKQFVKQMSTFQDSVMWCKIAATLMPTLGFQTTSKNFQMRYLLYYVSLKGA